MPQFQADPDSIVWKLHFRSSPDAVYQALATPEGRRLYWAESVDEVDGELHYVFLNGLENRGRILERKPSRRFVVEYFGWHVTFEMQADDKVGGTDFIMTCRGVTPKDRTQIIAGWVSWLLAMKAAVDHGVDLRNHDPQRAWWNGYADN